MSDNLYVLQSNIEVASAYNFTNNIPLNSVNLVYIDPPFNTKKTQKRGKLQYPDKYEDYLFFLKPILSNLLYALTNDGSILVHLDYREVHRVKILMDEIFGECNFMNEIIWCYDYGGRAKKKYSCKHDTILWYAVDNKNYTFNYDQLERIPYMAPNLVGEKKAKKGKTVVDWQFHTIVPTNSKEKTGYPTQKPLKFIERFVKVHSNPDDVLLDCFCGSGTFGVAAKKHGRKYLLCDQNPDAIDIARKRLDEMSITQQFKNQKIVSF